MIGHSHSYLESQWSIRIALRIACEGFGGGSTKGIDGRLDEDRRWEWPVVDSGFGSMFASPPLPALQVLQGDTNIIVVDGYDGDKEENPPTHTVE